MGRVLVPIGLGLATMIAHRFDRLPWEVSDAQFVDMALA